MVEPAGCRRRGALVTAHPLGTAGRPARVFANEPRGRRRAALRWRALTLLRRSVHRRRAQLLPRRRARTRLDLPDGRDSTRTRRRLLAPGRPPRAPPRDGRFSSRRDSVAALAARRLDPAPAPPHLDRCLSGPAAGLRPHESGSGSLDRTDRQARLDGLGDPQRASPVAVGGLGCNGRLRDRDLHAVPKAAAAVLQPALAAPGPFDLVDPLRHRHVLVRDGLDFLDGPAGLLLCIRARRGRLLVSIRGRGSRLLPPVAAAAAATPRLFARTRRGTVLGLRVAVRRDRRGLDRLGRLLAERRFGDVDLRRWNGSVTVQRRRSLCCRLLLAPSPAA